MKNKLAFYILVFKVILWTDLWAIPDRSYRRYIQLISPYRCRIIEGSLDISSTRWISLVGLLLTRWSLLWRCWGSRSGGLFLCLRWLGRTTAGALVFTCRWWKPGPVGTWRLGSLQGITLLHKFGARKLTSSDFYGESSFWSSHRSQGEVSGTSRLMSFDQSSMLHQYAWLSIHPCWFAGFEPSTFCARQGWCRNHNGFTSSTSNQSLTMSCVKIMPVWISFKMVPV